MRKNSYVIYFETRDGDKDGYEVHGNDELKTAIDWLKNTQDAVKISVYKKGKNFENDHNDVSEYYLWHESTEIQNSRIDEFGKAETPATLIRWIRRHFTEDEFYDQTYEVRQAVIKHLKERGINYRKWPIDYCMHRAFNYIKPKRSLMKNDRDESRFMFEGYQDQFRFSNDPTNPTTAALTGAIYECFEVLQDRFYFPDSAKTYDEEGHFFNIETGIGYDLKDVSEDEAILTYNPSGRRDDFILCRWIRNENGKYILDKESTAKGLSEFAVEYEIPEKQIQYYAKKWFGVTGVQGAKLPSDYDDLVEKTLASIKKPEPQADSGKLKELRLDICKAFEELYDDTSLQFVESAAFDEEYYFEAGVSKSIWLKMKEEGPDMEEAKITEALAKILEPKGDEYDSVEVTLCFDEVDFEETYVQMSIYLR